MLTVWRGIKNGNESLPNCTLIQPCNTVWKNIAADTLESTAYTLSLSIALVWIDATAPTHTFRISLFFFLVCFSVLWLNIHLTTGLRHKFVKAACVQWHFTLTVFWVWIVIPDSIGHFHFTNLKVGNITSNERQMVCRFLKI